MLKIKNVTAHSETHQLLNDISLDINPSEIHAVLGPKHSGKSALAHLIAGHPDIEVTEGSISWYRKKLTKLEPDQRVKEGIHIGFQMPIEFENLTGWELVKEVFSGSGIDLAELRIKYNVCCELLNLSSDHGDRQLNGGGLTISQAKRNELLHMLFSNPKLIILDEIDDGLDESEIMLVGVILRDFLSNSDRSALIFTNNQTLLDILNPTHVHFMISGEIKMSGDTELYKRIVEDGYSEFS